jgi:diketogulonate reductase-like aldo/keto reductase
VVAVGVWAVDLIAHALPLRLQTMANLHTLVKEGHFKYIGLSE